MLFYIMVSLQSLFPTRDYWLFYAILDNSLGGVQRQTDQWRLRQNYILVDSSLSVYYAILVYNQMVQMIILKRLFIYTLITDNLAIVHTWHIISTSSDIRRLTTPQLAFNCMKHNFALLLYMLFIKTAMLLYVTAMLVYFT